VQRSILFPLRREQRLTLCAEPRIPPLEGRAYFLALVRTHSPHVHVNCYPLEDANQALADLRAGRLQGAAVLLP